MRLVVFVLLVFAAGCGGPSPEERFAERACSTTLPWAQKMLETYEDVQLTRAVPGPDARATLGGLALRGRLDAMEFAKEIRALPPLEGDAERPARQRGKTWLDFSADQPVETMTEAVRHIRSLPKSLTLVESIRGLERLELDIVTAVFEMSGYLSPISQFIPDLYVEFQEADACKELEALGDE